VRPGGEESADADSGTVKALKKTSCPSLAFSLDALPCSRVEHFRPPGLGGGAGEQNQCGAARAMACSSLKPSPYCAEAEPLAS
jgi:hypothetical protein